MNMFRKRQDFLSPILLLSLLALFISACGGKHDDSQAPAEDTADTFSPPQNPVSASAATLRIGPLREIFNDSNKYQYAYAEKLGITPISGIRDAYFTSRPVVHIRSCKEYIVDSLTHSMPFLVPEAASLLRTVGQNFIDSLASRGTPGYRIRVTSLLRTASSVKRLRRVNVNATDSSTHKFGTTFDISYVRFEPSPSAPFVSQGDLKNILGQVLLDLRGQGRCLVKFEGKTGCFHITATR